MRILDLADVACSQGSAEACSGVALTAGSQVTTTSSVIEEEGMKESAID
jgi:hypothetical protein